MTNHIRILGYRGLIESDVGICLEYYHKPKNQPLRVSWASKCYRKPRSMAEWFTRLHSILPWFLNPKSFTGNPLVVMIYPLHVPHKSHISSATKTLMPPSCVVGNEVRLKSLLPQLHHQKTSQLPLTAAFTGTDGGTIGDEIRHWTPAALVVLDFTNFGFLQFLGLVLLRVLVHFGFARLWAHKLREGPL